MNTTNAPYNVARACLSFGAEVLRSSVGITSFYGSRAIDQVIANWGEWNQPKLAQTAIVELQNYCTEMATVIPFAIERFAIGEVPMTLPDIEYPGEAGFDSRPAKSHLIGAKPTMLPVRVGEASQGWALYFVPLDWAKKRIEEREKQFTAIHTGMGRTPLIIYALDHRESDLGTYLEIGVALLVRPQSKPRDLPGLLFLSLIVSEQFTIDASRKIWGYRKALAPTMEARYSDGFATFCMDPQDPTTLSISFPRFGSARSSRVPCYIYSVPERDMDGVAHRTVLSRSSSGEGIQYGGHVDLRLSNQPNCVCRSASGADALCICAMLRDLPLPERPAANGWAQFISGEFGPAIPCT
jgi:hypothetical protein